jgi:hypothetical protein
MKLSRQTGPSAPNSPLLATFAEPFDFQILQILKYCFIDVKQIQLIFSVFRVVDTFRGAG